MRSAVSMTSLLVAAALSACGSQTGPETASTPAVTPEQASAVAARPVMMGGEPGLDACAGVSQIKPGRFVLIREAPDPDAEIVASLPEGTALWICEEDGALEGWTGVAFDTPDGPQTCEGPGSPSAEKVQVPSVCQSGWAQVGDDVDNIAG